MMEISNDANIPAVATGKRPNVFRRTVDAFNNKVQSVQDSMNQMVTEELMETLLPKIRKLTPMAQKELKKYLNNGERVIVVKMVDDDVQIMIMRQEHVEVNLREGSDAEQAVERMESLDKCIEVFLSGQFENAIK